MRRPRFADRRVACVGAAKVHSRTTRAHGIAGRAIITDGNARPIPADTLLRVELEADAAFRIRDALLERLCTSNAGAEHDQGDDASRNHGLTMSSSALSAFGSFDCPR